MQLCAVRAVQAANGVLSLCGRLSRLILLLHVCFLMCRQRNLLERLGALEEAYAQQMQRLKGYMPASAFSRLRGRLGPGLGAGGSVLQRMELLEEGLELLLRAQELSWQSEQPRRRDRCCGGCTIC